ncbi:hypothetical protein [Hafnia phage vB_HpaA_yong1]|uniref:Nucleotide kinase n=1 Tax=Hafnia phage vB_HpaA_yong1 TaxID=2562199 RepID=A0A482MHH1_9CAUD|nr:hypothetical protein [Hafnia phage vB_HpaA_yong1]
MPWIENGDGTVTKELLALNVNVRDEASCGNGVSCRGISCDQCPMVGQVSGNGEYKTIRDLRASVGACSEDDGVREPSHYQVFDGVESIEIIARSMTVSEFRGFCMGNVLKYRLRAGKKSELATMEKDLNKAAFYQELFDLHKGKCYATE